MTEKKRGEIVRRFACVLLVLTIGCGKPAAKNTPVAAPEVAAPVVAKKLTENGFFRLDPLPGETDVLVAKTKEEYEKAAKSIQDFDTDSLNALVETRRVQMVKPVAYSRGAREIDGLIQTTIANPGFALFTGYVNPKCFVEIEKFPDSLFPPQPKTLEDLKPGDEIFFVGTTDPEDPLYITKTQSDLDLVYATHASGDKKKLNELSSSKIYRRIPRPCDGLFQKLDGKYVEVITNFWATPHKGWVLKDRVYPKTEEPGKK